MIAFGLLLFVACANIANLVMVRATGRERETALRAALGAGRARMFQQRVVESSLMTLLGGGAAVLVALWLTTLFLASQPGILPRTDAIRFGAPVFLFALAASVVCGLLFTLFIGRENDPSRVFLASIGAVTFAAGLGASLGIAPLFITLVAGMTVAATSPHAEALGEQLERLRHPLFVMVLLLCGAHWTPAQPILWTLVPLLVLLRYALFTFTAGGLLRNVPETPLRVPRVASGLLAQGTLAPAMALNFALIFPEMGSIVLTVVLAGTLINDLWSLRGLERLLVDVGEGPVLQVAVAGSAESTVEEDSDTAAADAGQHDGPGPRGEHA